MKTFAGRLRKPTLIRKWIPIVRRPDFTSVVKGSEITKDLHDLHAECEEENGKQNPIPENVLISTHRLFHLFNQL